MRMQIFGKGGNIKNLRRNSQGKCAKYFRAFAAATAHKTFRGAAFAVFGQNDKIFMKTSK